MVDKIEQIFTEALQHFSKSSTITDNYSNLSNEKKINTSSNSSLIKISLNLSNFKSKYNIFSLDNIYNQYQISKNTDKLIETFEEFCNNNQIDINSKTNSYLPKTKDEKSSNIISQYKFWILLNEYFKHKLENNYTIEHFVKLSNQAIDNIENPLSNDNSKVFVKYFNNFIKNNFNSKLLSNYINKYHKKNNYGTNYTFLLQNYKNQNWNSKKTKVKDYQKENLQNNKKYYNRSNSKNNDYHLSPMIKEKNKNLNLNLSPFSKIKNQVKSAFQLHSRSREATPLNKKQKK